MKFYIVIFSFLLIGFVPFFGTVDNIGSQWFYLAGLNLLLLLFNFRDSHFKQTLSLIYNQPYLRIYFLFIFFALLSFFYTLNISLTIVDFSRLIIVLLSIINLIHIIRSKDLFFISIAMTIIVSLEVLYSFTPLILYLLKEPFSSINFSVFSAALKGVAGNKNVLAFDLCFKVPFIIYSIFHLRNFRWKFLASLSLFFTFLLIFFLSSRASFFSIIFVLSLFSIFFIYSYKNYSFQSIFLFVATFIFIAFSINSFSSITNLNVVSKVQSVSSSDESTSHRLTLYENALDYISTNPFFGCGLGNWKIESLAYWSNLMSGYTVPYHAHNDFLELSAEIGIIGGGLYLFLFVLLSFQSLIKLIKTKKIKYVIYLSCLSVYFVDAFFNFPLERAISQVNFIILMVLPSLNFFKND